jgi:asparagine synthase (glutamine-hydrolysing)
MIRDDGHPVDLSFLEKTVPALSFSGPDGTSFWAIEAVGGCFTLMRTGPAPQAECQPVVLDKRFWLWGDVRLDHRQELQTQLGELQANPEETSENLLLRAWRKWGPSALERASGDYSFALWDAQEQTLWCTRDFVGARPFYYPQVRGIFCFSNTLEILLQVPEISAELGESFLGDFLLQGSSMESSRTVYRDIRSLPPGHLLRILSPTPRCSPDSGSCQSRNRCGCQNQKTTSTLTVAF